MANHLPSIVALATASSLSVLATTSPAGLLHSESFATDGTLDQYVGPGEVFSAYVVNGHGTAAVSSGKLAMEMPAGPDNGVTDRAYAHIDLGAERTLLSVQLDFTGVQYSAANAAFRLYAGAFDEMSDFNPGINGNGAGREWAKINVAAGNPYTLSAYGNGTSAEGSITATMGETYTWYVFFNHSAAAETYLGPDGLTHNLSTSAYTLFMDDDVVAENVAKGANSYASGTLEGLILNVGRNYEGGTSRSTIDNIIVRDDLALIVPEPASALLLGSLGLLAARRRRG